MAGCPRCGTDVDREASFCTNCGTDLRARGARPGDVILVLDRGLVQFAKFALAVLGIFLVFGAFVFGFDLRKLTGEMHDRRAEMEAASRQIGTATTATEASVADLEGKVADATTRIADATAQMEKRLQDAEDQVADLKQKVVEAEAALARIHRFRREAEIAVSNLASLDAEELARAEAAARDPAIRTDASAGTDVERPGKLFAPGSEIPFAFLGEPTAQERQAVRDAIAAWQPLREPQLSRGRRPRRRDHPGRVRTGWRILGLCRYRRPDRPGEQPHDKFRLGHNRPQNGPQRAERDRTCAGLPERAPEPA